MYQIQEPVLVPNHRESAVHLHNEDFFVDHSSIKLSKY